MKRLSDEAVFLAVFALFVTFVGAFVIVIALTAPPDNGGCGRGTHEVAVQCSKGCMYECRPNRP